MTADTETGPSHGDRGTCENCGGEIKYIEYTAWNGSDYDVLDAWWAHNKRPADGHDAKPKDQP